MTRPAVLPSLLHATVATLTLGALSAPAASADPPLPDFGGYPKAASQDFVVRDSLVYSVRGFSTPSGLFCTSSSHRGMSLLDCYGPFPAAPDGANSVHLSSASPVPVVFKTGTVGPAEFEGHPLRLLPAGVTYAFDKSECAHDGRFQLACVIHSGAETHGFSVAAGRTEQF